MRGGMRKARGGEHHGRGGSGRQGASNQGNGGCGYGRAGGGELLADESLGGARRPLPRRFLTCVFTTTALRGTFVWGGRGVVSPPGPSPIGILLYFNSTYDISAAEVRPRNDGKQWTGYEFRGVVSTFARRSFCLHINAARLALENARDLAA